MISLSKICSFRMMMLTLPKLFMFQMVPCGAGSPPTYPGAGSPTYPRAGSPTYPGYGGKETNGDQEDRNEDGGKGAVSNFLILNILIQYFFQNFGELFSFLFLLYIKVLICEIHFFILISNNSLIFFCIFLFLFSHNSISFHPTPSFPLNKLSFLIFPISYPILPTLQFSFPPFHPAFPNQPSFFLLSSFKASFSPFKPYFPANPAFPYKSLFPLKATFSLLKSPFSSNPPFPLKPPFPPPKPISPVNPSLLPLLSSVSPSMPIPPPPPILVLIPPLLSSLYLTSQSFHRNKSYVFH